MDALTPELKLEAWTKISLVVHIAFLYHTHQFLFGIIDARMQIGMYTVGVFLCRFPVPRVLMLKIPTEIFFRSGSHAA